MDWRVFHNPRVCFSFYPLFLNLADINPDNGMDFGAIEVSNKPEL